ncbi:putative HC-toxin efflux carrier TOXA 2 [Colletotrichum chlorophyti]|uniref:Putative HC-toxin efflux carrier TOXA 2 n=1 Tax=Colletotrichum chlorophyti TaxID=708187 RepID=A0A1Q8RUF2_9PEZI|nr:putative HC-toxin efflux carrier TOXA 2 [Colletotrichum chlorophyti]
MGQPETTATKQAERPLDGISAEDARPSSTNSNAEQPSPEKEHAGERQQNDAAEGSSQVFVMDTSDFPGPRALTFIMVALFLALFAANLDTTILATAIPSITNEFRTIKDVSWYAAAIMLLTLLASLLIFEVGSIVCALAPNSTSLVVGRAVAGLGASGVTAGVFILIAFSAPPKFVPAFMGLGGATYAAASLAGPLLGGVFTQSVTWRWCFWINLPIGGVTAAVLVVAYQTPKAAQPQPATNKEKVLQMDLPGTFLVMAAVVCFILAFQWGGSFKPWNDSTVIGTIVGFVLIAIVFVGCEIYMGDRAILPPRLMKMRRIWSNCAHVFFVSGGFFIHIYYLPIFFQSIQGLSPIDSGVRNLPINIGCFLSIASGFAVSMYGRIWAPMMAVGSAVATIGAGLIYTFSLDTSAGKYIGYQVITGVGTGMALQIPLMANQAAVTPMDISSVSAITLFYQIIGGSFSVACAQAAFAATLVRRIAVYAPDVEAAKLLHLGATELRSQFSGAELEAALMAYMDGLKVAFAIAIALLGVGFVLALVPKWDDLRPGQQANSKASSMSEKSASKAV